MTPLFRKLNLSTQTEIVVLNAPDMMNSELESLEGVTILKKPSARQEVFFALVFVKTLDEIEKAASLLLPKSSADAILWFAYPKMTSKKYRCEFNRDNGWDLLRSADFDTVRAVAIDADWSALRFRRVEFIKSAQTK